jgi:hypothetical protein
MAELREIALRIAAVLLAEEQPEPLGVDLWNQSPDTAARLVEAVIEECGDAGAALAKVRVDPCVAVAMGGPPAGRGWSYGDTGVETDAALFQRAEFHRRA